MTKDTKKDVDCSGTARATHELSEYEMLEYDYGEEAALSVTTKAFQRYDQSITQADVKSTIKVIRAARTGEVSVSAERERFENQAKGAVEGIIQDLSTTKETIE